MPRHGSFLTSLLTLAVVTAPLPAADPPDVLPGTERLELERPLWEEMVDGLDRFCLQEIEASVERRARHWKPDYSHPLKHRFSVQPNRHRLQRSIGALGERVRPERGFRIRPNEGDAIAVRAIRWPVFDGVNVEGLILIPPGKPTARIVAIPDADWTPEAFAGIGAPRGVPDVARRLARSGCLVVVPTLVSRGSEFSGEATIARTNQSHREWVYRPAFQMGRHVVGYEVQRVLAVVDRFTQLHREDGRLPIGVTGVGEGGRIALYAAAIDLRIDAVHVAGYFGPRENVWREPIDRNVWRLLDEFGDAEIASLVAPRAIVVENCAAPEYAGPKPPRTGQRGGAAPGEIRRPDSAAVLREFERMKPAYEALKANDAARYISNTDPNAPCGAGLGPLLAALKVQSAGSDAPLAIEEPLPEPTARQERVVNELIDHVQGLLDRSDRFRYASWGNADRGRSKGFTPEEWEAFAEPKRERFHDEVIGRLPDPTMPMNPRTRKVIDEPTHTGYEVVLDVYPDVVAGGILLVPKGMKPGERRPVVVCQHGLEGTPEDTITTDETSRAWRAYKGFSTQLVERGFVVYAPQNPYKGGDRFRTLQRKSNPLGRSLFSYIVRQHERTLAWLAEQPFVDADRIGFYGLSYGGKTAMRVPALLPPREGKPGYCLSICSADFNEWIRKCVTNDAPHSYVFTGEYEMFEWNMGHEANYAELAMLISPRPFMVERGHDDGVAPDEWVAWEYAKVRRHYVKLGIGDRTEIEWFNGPHTIHGQGTFAFLHRHLKWPEPE